MLRCEVSVEGRRHRPLGGRARPVTPGRGARPGADVWLGTIAAPRNREEERLTAMAVRNVPPSQDSSRCAQRTLWQPFLPSVITATGIDIHRYICNAWFGRAFLLASLPVPA